MKYGLFPGAEKIPKMVVVNTSYVCNAKCIHCTHSIDTSSRTIVGKDYFIDEKIFKKLADECGPENAFIRVTGTGEPMLHPQLVELVRYAKDRGCKVSMITNGSLLTADKADALLDCGIDGVEFSVDAASKDIYSIIRRGLDFENLLSNISYLKKQRDKVSPKTNLICSFIEQEANKEEREIAESFWVPKYVDKIQFRVWLEYGKLDAMPNRSNLMESKREPCPYPFDRINMDSRGDFHLCAFDIDHETNFGNIMERPLEDIWHDKGLEEIRQKHLEEKWNDVSICNRCTDWGCRSWKVNFWKLHDDAEAMKRKTNTTCHSSEDEKNQLALP